MTYKTQGINRTQRPNNLARTPLHAANFSKSLRSSFNNCKEPRSAERKPVRSAQCLKQTPPAVTSLASPLCTYQGRIIQGQIV